MPGKHGKLLLLWGALFAFSLLFLLLNVGLLRRTEGILVFPPLDQPSGEPGEEEPPPEGAYRAWSIVLGVVAAVTSAGGFIATTFFALREDRRESALHELQLEKLKREIEQKDLEIAELRREQGGQHPPGP